MVQCIRQYLGQALPSLFVEEITMDPITVEAKYIREVVKKLNTFIDRTWEAEAKKSGLTRPQINVLQELYHCPGLSLTELSNRMDMAHSTVSGIIDRLEKKGLVVRRSDTEDKRFLRLYLSPTVDSFLTNEMPASLDAPLIAELSELTVEERAKIREGLAILERTFIGKYMSGN
jgi:DNA-binding MarR family transcriptional regulator